MSEQQLPCPGCADGTLLATWPPPSSAPYRETPRSQIAVQACRTCAGVWVDRATLDAVIQAAVQDARPSTTRAVRRKTMAAGQATAKIVYRHCPACKQAMLRKNFGSISGIVVDVCGHHGTFFDYGELPEVVAFVRSGGLAAAQRNADAENMRDAKSRVTREALVSPGMGPVWLDGDLDDPASHEFLRRVGVFVRNMFR